MTLATTLPAVPMGASHEKRAVPGRDATLRLGLIEQVDAFLALREEWDALFERAALPHQVFQSHVVLRHWAAHYLDAQTRLSIVTLRRGGRLVMVWPLVRQHRLGIMTLRFMGIPIAQFGDVLVETTGDEAELLGTDWSAVRSLRADIFEARKLRADSALASS